MGKDIKVFVISDTHFGQEKMLTFLRADGSLLRPEFKTIEEMDSYMVEKWNSIVRPQDKVYHLGDVALNNKGIHLLGKCNGDKVLIKGNHDNERISLYRRYFRDVRACHVYNGVVLSHVPMHPDCVGRFDLNIHGHMHSNFIMLNGEKDNRYVNVCVEHTGYGPVLLDSVISEARNARRV